MSNVVSLFGTSKSTQSSKINNPTLVLPYGSCIKNGEGYLIIFLKASAGFPMRKIWSEWFERLITALVLHNTSHRVIEDSKGFQEGIYIDTRKNTNNVLILSGAINDQQNFIEDRTTLDLPPGSCIEIGNKCLFITLRNGVGDIVRKNWSRWLILFLDNLTRSNIMHETIKDSSCFQDGIRIQTCS